MPRNTLEEKDNTWRRNCEKAKNQRSIFLSGFLKRLETNSKKEMLQNITTGKNRWVFWLIFFFIGWLSIVLVY